MIKRLFSSALLATLFFSNIQEGYAQPNLANNANQTSVLNHLIAGVNAHNLADITLFTALSQLPPPDAQRALEQMSGEAYTNIGLISELANRQFVRRLFDPLRPLLQNTSCFDEGNYYNCYEYDGLCYPYGEPLKTKRIEDDVAFWLDFGGGQTFLTQDHHARGFHLSHLEVSLGGHTSLNKFWTLGMGLGYEYDNTHHKVGGSGNNSTALIGLYSLYRPSTYYFICDLVFGYNQTEIKRRIDAGNLHWQDHAKPKSYQGTLYLEGGKNFFFSVVNFQPFIGLEVDFFNINKFSEHRISFLDLSFKNKNHRRASSRLGVHLSTSGLSVFSFDFDLAWQCLLNSTSDSLRAQFTDFGATFKVHGVSLSRNNFDAEVLVAAKLCDSISLYTEFSSQCWQRAATYTLTAGLMAKW